MCYQRSSLTSLTLHHLVICSLKFPRQGVKPFISQILLGKIIGCGGEELLSVSWIQKQLVSGCPVQTLMPSALLAQRYSPDTPPLDGDWSTVQKGPLALFTPVTWFNDGAPSWVWRLVPRNAIGKFSIDKKCQPALIWSVHMGIESGQHLSGFHVPHPFSPNHPVCVWHKETGGRKWAVCLEPESFSRWLPDFGSVSVTCFSQSLFL